MLPASAPCDWDRSQHGALHAGESAPKSWPHMIPPGANNGSHALISVSTIIVRRIEEKPYRSSSFAPLPECAAGYDTTRLQ
jgi:hypothetical protein